MRIFLAILSSGNSSVPGSKTWFYNFYEPLIDLKHDVFLFRIEEVVRKYKLKYGTVTYKDKMSELLLDEFIKENTKKKFDFFLSYFRDYDIYLDVIEQIKNKGVLTANFSCNNTHQFYLTKEIAPHFNYNLHSEKSAGIDFTNIGANPIWFQMAANPNHYNPLDISFNHDITFIGASYANRAKYIHHLLSNGTDIHCYGPNWLINRPKAEIKNIYKETKRLGKIAQILFTQNKEKRFKLSSEINNYDLQTYLRTKYSDNMHYPVSDSEMIKLYSSSRINLGFLEVYSSDNNVHSYTKQHLHLREFEVPMSGGLYFTNYSEELAEHYVPDKEVIVFSNEHELTDKVKYYLKHPKAADKVRKAGHERALKCHTYQKRFTDLFNNIGISEL